MHLFNDKSMIDKLLFGLLMSLFSVACSAQDAGPAVDGRIAKVDALFEHFNEGKQPGAAVLIIKDGEILLAKEVGRTVLQAGRGR